MKSNLKSYLFQSLEKLPRYHGDKLYHLIQNLINNKDLDYKINSTFSSFRVLRKIVKKNRIEVEKSIIVEIGSGWLPLMPYFLKYLGKASRIISFDLYQHYQQKKIRELNQVFSQKFNHEIQEKEGCDFALPEGIDYLPQTDITNQSIPEADIIFSRFVLEHVEPELIRKIHERFMKELKPGSFIIHFISPSDHRAYTDKTLSLQDFLRFSEKEWNQIQTRFDYHNRLRLPQYLKIFKDLGYEIVDLTYDVPKKNSENYRKFKNLKLHRDFKDYTDEELMAGSINIVLKV